MRPSPRGLPHPVSHKAKARILERHCGRTQCGCVPLVVAVFNVGGCRRGCRAGQDMVSARHGGAGERSRSQLEPTLRCPMQEPAETTRTEADAAVAERVS